MITIASQRTRQIPTSEPRKVDAVKTAKQIAKRSCRILTTTTDDGPHAVAVLYVAIGTDLYVNTRRSSRKARNIAKNPNVSLCIPIRRLPIGPPSSVQFAAHAVVLASDDPEIDSCLRSGALKRITSHGELALDGNCFVRITPTGRINTYGLGMPLLRLLTDPLHASGITDIMAFPAPFAVPKGPESTRLSITPVA